jgi:hypothetical protein
MNETMSLVLATTILAIGGLGLYMYKQSDDFKEENYDDYSSGSDSDSELDSQLDYEDDKYSNDDFVDYEPKTVQRRKTKRNKTSNGTKKKRY